MPSKSTYFFALLCIFESAILLRYNVDHVLSLTMIGNEIRDASSHQNRTANFSIEMKSVKKILLWTQLYSTSDGGLGIVRDALERYKCSHKCFVSNNRKEIHKVDTVIMRTFNRKDLEILPNRTDPKQIFVFFNRESQLRSFVHRYRTKLFDYFNLTITYMSSEDTDVVAKYGVTYKREQRRIEMLPSKEVLLNKTKQVLWLVSFCRAPSARNAYVKELAKYIQVDTFGACGNTTCTFKNLSCNTFDKLSKHYRYYLAFENSFCNDYMSEKPFRTLRLPYPMIPIVLGRGNYKAELPPSSFIDVRDYKSPKHLANRLNYLAKNVTAYASYFAWKKDYEVQMRDYSYSDAFCNLCDILHTDGYPYKSRFDADKYFSAKKNCLHGKKEKKIVHL